MVYVKFNLDRINNQYFQHNETLFDVLIIFLREVGCFLLSIYNYHSFIPPFLLNNNNID